MKRATETNRLQDSIEFAAHDTGLAAPQATELARTVAMSVAYGEPLNVALTSALLRPAMGLSHAAVGAIACTMLDVLDP